MTDAHSWLGSEVFGAIERWTSGEDVGPCPCLLFEDERWGAFSIDVRPSLRMTLALCEADAGRAETLKTRREIDGAPAADEPRIGSAWAADGSSPSPDHSADSRGLGLDVPTVEELQGIAEQRLHEGFSATSTPKQRTRAIYAAIRRELVRRSQSK